MAYDEALTERVRKALGSRRGRTERKMFGGIAFMLNGNMVCGVLAKNLIVRLGKERYEAALDEPYTEPFAFTGTPLRGMIVVTSRGTAKAPGLKKWVGKALAVATALPPKKKKPKKRPVALPWPRSAFSR